MQTLSLFLYLAMIAAVFLHTFLFAPKESLQAFFVALIYFALAGLWIFNGKIPGKILPDITDTHYFIALAITFLLGTTLFVKFGLNLRSFLKDR